jgi:predicted AlkP superfamily phosphohydrolase/phosphomutase
MIDASGLPGLVGYVGPGVGIALGGSLAALIAGVFAGVASILASPILWLVNRLRRLRRRRAAVRRIVIIGLDGLSPDLVERFRDDLPNLHDLGAAGMMTPLGTTFPAISPAAWSTFTTGLRPARHGIYDFIGVDRSQSPLAPMPAGFRLVATPRRLRLGPVSLPLAGRVHRTLQLRQGRPFWVDAARAGLPTTILRVPMTFPPDRFGGRQLSGMCLPDLRGTQGTYTLIGADRPAAPSTIAGAGATDSGGGARVALEPLGRRRFRARIPGPREAGESAEATVTLTAIGNPDAPRLRVSGCEPAVTLTPGGYSPWVRLAFRLRGGRITGICRLRLLDPGTDGAPRVYATPIMVDPARPAMPIAQPAMFAPYLAGTAGTFATLGLAEDTWAYDDGVIDAEAFLAQCAAIRGERESTLMDALAARREGIVVAVFDDTDRVQHMFRRELDAGADGPGGSAIRETYAAADAVVGRVRAKLRPGDLLWVVSDHGFAPFRRQIDLNAWLRDRGDLALRDDVEPDEPWLTAIDFTQTRAFALGLGGIYLNIAGRDPDGIVEPDAAPSLARELAEALAELRDPESPDSAPVARTAVNLDAGPFADRGPTC